MLSLTAIIESMKPVTLGVVSTAVPRYAGGRACVLLFFHVICYYSGIGE